jgi:acyl-CoA thioesterase I
MDIFISGRNVAVWIFCGALILCSCSCARKKKEPAGVQERAEVGGVTAAEDLRPAIVALGDSLTAGQGVDPDSNYPSLLQRKVDKEGLAYKVLNYGVSGDTSGQGLNRLDPIINLKPAIVIVELGANDGLRGIPVEVTKQNIAAIIERLQAAGATVVLAGMRVPPNYGPQYTIAFGEIFRDLAKKYRTPLIPFFLEGVGGHVALNQDDGIHPTAEGYGIIVGNVWKVLKPLLLL